MINLSVSYKFCANMHPFDNEPFMLMNIEYIVAAITALIGYIGIKECPKCSLVFVVVYSVISNILSIIVMILIPELYLYAMAEITLSLIVAVTLWINYKTKMRNIARDVALQIQSS